MPSKPLHLRLRDNADSSREQPSKPDARETVAQQAHPEHIKMPLVIRLAINILLVVLFGFLPDFLRRVLLAGAFIKNFLKPLCVLSLQTSS